MTSGSVSIPARAFEHLEDEVDAVLFAAVEGTVGREVVDFPGVAGLQMEGGAGAALPRRWSPGSSAWGTRSGYR